MQGEACKDKSVLGKTPSSDSLRSPTPCSVGLRGVCPRIVSHFFLDQQKILLSTPCSVTQFWIFEKYSNCFEISSNGS